MKKPVSQIAQMEIMESIIFAQIVIHHAIPVMEEIVIIV